MNGRLHFLFKLVGFVTACFLVFYLMYLLKDYVHAVLLWAENQPPWAVVFIFIALFTLVSLPLAWGYIVVNLACGYLFGALYGLLVTVFTATIGILIAHIISKVIFIDIHRIGGSPCATPPGHNNLRIFSAFSLFSHLWLAEQD